MRGLTALAALALTASVTVAQEADCTDADGTAYAFVDHFGGGIVSAWVTGDGTPFTMIGACNAHRFVRIEMLPDMSAPQLEPYLTGTQEFTLAQLAQEMADRGYYVEMGRLKAAACVCSAAMLARHRVAG